MDNLFEYLEEYKIADELCANAYETCTPAVRNLIKTAIAFHFSENTVHEAQEVFIEKSSSGFCKGYKRQALENVLIFIDKEYSAPAKFLSLLCQAIRANTKQLFVFIEKTMPEKQFSLFLACLELCGIENSYYFPGKEKIENLAIQFQQEHMQTKYVFCSEKEQHFQVINPIDIFTDNLVLSICAQSSQKEMLSLSFGSSAKVTWNTENLPRTSREHFGRLLQSPQTYCDVSYISEKSGTQNYGLGMEFCFKHPQLPQNFFYDILYFSNLDINYPANE